MDPHHKMAVSVLVEILMLVDKSYGDDEEVADLMHQFVDHVENLGGGRHTEGTIFKSIDWTKTIHEWLDVFIEDNR